MQVTENLAQSDPNKEGNILAHMIENSQRGIASDKLPLSSSVAGFFSISLPVFWGYWLYSKASSSHSPKTATSSSWCYVLPCSDPTKER